MVYYQPEEPLVRTTISANCNSPIVRRVRGPVIVCSKEEENELQSPILGLRLLILGSQLYALPACTASSSYDYVKEIPTFDH